MIPGSRNTTMWEKDRGGRLNVNDVSDGELVGIVIIGQPVGMMPKSWGTAIAERLNIATCGIGYWQSQVARTVF